VRAAVDELMVAADYCAEDAARIIRATAGLLQELRKPDRIEGRLLVRLRHRPGRASTLGDVQHDVTTRVQKTS
jgi:hypothetical protein